MVKRSPLGKHLELKFGKYYLIALFIIIIIACAFMPINKRRREAFVENDNSYKCKDFLVKSLMTKKNYTYAQANDEINKRLLIDPKDYMGEAEFNSLPREVKQSMPKMKLDELLLKMRKNVVVDQEGKHIMVDECILPINVLELIQDGNSQDVYLQRSYTNPNMKECKIGNVVLPTNIKNTLPEDLYSLKDMNPANDRFAYYGCLVKSDDLDVLKNNLKEVNKYYDKNYFNSMNRLKNEYKLTNEQMNNAISNNIQSQNLLKQESSVRRVTEGQVPIAQTAMQEQIRATNNSTIKLENKLSELQTLDRAVITQQSNRVLGME